MREKRTKPLSSGLCAGLVVAAGCLWGTAGLFVRHLNAIGLTAMTIVLLRSAVTALLLSLVVLCVRPQLFRIRLRDLWCFLGTGIVSVLFFNFCYFSTIQLSSMAVAATLMYTSPVFVMLLSLCLFGERITVRKLVALALAVAGCVLVSGVLGSGGALTPQVLLLGLGSGLGYGLYGIFSHYALQRGYHSLTVTVYTFLFATLGGLPFLQPAQIRTAVAADGGWLLLWLLCYAVINTVLPFLLYTAALTGMETSKAAVIASVEPVMAALLGLVVFHEVPSLAAAAGILLVLVAVLVLNLGGSRLPAKTPDGGKTT